MLNVVTVFSCSFAVPTHKREDNTPAWVYISYGLDSSSICLISFLLFPCKSVWENTRAWVPNFLQPYWMVPSFIAKRDNRNGRRVACRKLITIIIWYGVNFFATRNGLILGRCYADKMLTVIMILLLWKDSKLMTFLCHLSSP